MGAINFILSLARKILARESKGITTIPNMMAVEQKAAEIAATLQRAGIPLERADQIIRSEKDLVGVLNLIKSTPPVMKEVPSGIKSAKILDLEGKEIKNTRNIMGGKELPPDDPDLPPPGSRGGPDDIAAPIQSAEESLKDMIEAENKKNIANMRNRKKMLEDSIDNTSPGFSGDRKVDAELVAEDLAERMGLVYDDLPTKQRLDLYNQAYTGLSKQKFKGTKKPKDADDQESSYDDGPADFDPDADNETFAQGGRAGFFMGGPNPKGLELLRQILKDVSKKGIELGKFEGVDLSALDMLKFSNPKRFNKLLEDAKGKVNVKEGIMGTDSVKIMQQGEKERRKNLTKGVLNVAKDMKARDDAIVKKIEEEAEKTIIPRTKIMMMEGMGMSEEAAEKAARDLAKAAKNMRVIDDSPKITDEGLLQLENVLKNMETGNKPKRDLNADGGRIGLKDGMNRRTFLKFLTGLVSIPIVGKIVKPLKLTKGVKNVPIIKTGDVPGKPEWFDALVNKVIIEGDDVTKGMATQERQVIHMKKIDDDTSVMVTQDLNDGSIMVDIDDPIRNVMGEQGDTKVMMMLKKGQADETTKGTPADEFSFTENDMRNYMDGPDDYTTEFTENTVDKMKDLTSDLGKIESYATGKKPTMKQIVESKKRKDMVKFAEEKPAEYAAERGPDIDYSDYDDGMASGGIARMLGE